MERVYLLFMVISGTIRSAKSACGEHAEDETWWDSSNDESFCLCQSDGTALCSQSYAEILSNSALKEAILWGECGKYLRGECAADSTLWTPSDSSDLSHPCPRCTCDTVDEVSYADDLMRSFYVSGRQCFEGTCSSHGYIDWSEKSIYAKLDEEIEKEPWICPPSTCDYNNDIKYLGQKWFVDIEDDPTCQSLCTCKSDGTVSCSTSYAGIVEDDALIDAFNQECGWIYEDWFDEEGSCISSETDVSAWVSTTSWGGSCDCPQLDTVECDPDQAFQHKVSYLNVFCFVILSYFWFV
eukprot:789279_1